MYTDIFSRSAEDLSEAIEALDLAGAPDTDLSSDQTPDGFGYVWTPVSRPPAVVSGPLSKSPNTTVAPFGGFIDTPWGQIPAWAVVVLVLVVLMALAGED